MYNYDFALATIPVQIILLVFYLSRRNLPIRATRSFLFLMATNLCMTITDVIACEIDERFAEYPLPVLFLSNIIYFIFFVARSWALFDFTAETTHAYTQVGGRVRLYAAIPVIAVIAVICISPWKQVIFGCSTEIGYYKGSGYWLILFISLLYIFMSIACALIRRRHMERYFMISIFACNILLLMGLPLKEVFGDILITSYISLLAILIIYLTVQNPDLYRDRKTHLFNWNAMERITKEYIFRDIPFHCVTCNVQKFESSKALYGNRQIRRSMRLIGEWMLEQFPDYYIFYFGNGEFMMLKEGTFEDKRAEIIERLYSRFEDSWKGEGTEVTVDMSVLIIPYHVLSADSRKIGDIITYSYHNAYVMNKRGVVVFDKSMIDDMSRFESVEVAVRKAVQDNRVEIYLQPIYSVQESKVIGAEALARINDPVLGFIPPGEFIRVAEHTGDIMELGRQIFEKVCIFISDTRIREIGLNCINVNLSPVQCMNAQMAGELMAIADDHNVPLNLIDFEITETFIEDRRIMQNQMTSLHKFGAEFSLDDFGTGTSNITRLMKLPIHIVKLDMEVVRSYFSGESTLLPDLVRMFQNAHMKIIAEGIETAEMKDALAEMGCDYQQGYYFSKPVPPVEFVEYVKRQSI